MLAFYPKTVVMQIIKPFSSIIVPRIFPENLFMQKKEINIYLNLLLAAGLMFPRAHEYYLFCGKWQIGPLLYYRRYFMSTHSHFIIYLRTFLVLTFWQLPMTIYIPTQEHMTHYNTNLRKKSVFSVNTYFTAPVYVTESIRTSSIIQFLMHILWGQPGLGHRPHLFTKISNLAPPPK